jgi:hypothetical protein
MSQLLIWHLKIYLLSALIMLVGLFIYFAIIDLEGGWVMSLYCSVGLCSYLFFWPLPAVLIAFFASLRYKLPYVRFVLFGLAIMWFFISMNLLFNSFEHFSFINGLISCTYPAVLLYCWFRELDIKVINESDQLW